jgi:E3 SUMO-protein ligase PIAS1
MNAAMVQHRSTVQIPLKAHELQRHLTDPSIKVMVFCALGNSGVQDIAFPHQAELKVNSGEVKANLRGLKNKPGSTRPVDITHLLRLRPPQYSNTVDFTYAMTNKASCSVPGKSACPEPSKRGWHPAPLCVALTSMTPHFSLLTHPFLLQRFYLCVYACRSHPVSSLVDHLKSGNKISRQSVVQESMYLGGGIAAQDSV